MIAASPSMMASAVLVLAAILLGSCSGDSSGEARRIVLTGSSTVAPLALEIAKRFESEHIGVRVDIQTGGSSRGIADTRRGTADIGMVSRALTNIERDLQVHQIAIDGVCVILHASNPVTALSRRQLVDIYTGKIPNWRDVGGADASVTVVNKAEGRATLEVFLAHLGIDNDSIRADVVIGDNEHAIKTVAGDVDAIGYVSVGTAEYEAKHGVPIKLLPADGVQASTSTLSDGRFPISRPLSLITKSEPHGLVRQFIDYCQSAQVHDLIQTLYFVPSSR